MQEIKKRRIVLASVLKPVNDPRMSEKIGPTLAQRYEVHVIGQPGINASSSSLYFHPLASFTRLSFARLIAPLKILRDVIALKPGVLIICTQELLFIAIAAKIMVGCKIIYDVQENYWRNIRYGNAFPFFLRPFIAGYVRGKEWITSALVDLYFLAESSYQLELGFTNDKRIVLENKLRRSGLVPPERSDKAEKHITTLLFTGTIAETTGIFIAIRIAAELFHLDPSIRLLILGFCPHQKTLERVKSEIMDKPFITFDGGDRFVPHEQILSAVQRADFGIIAYPPNPSTAGSIPTKLFEYLGCLLPVLLIDHPPWTARCEPYPAAISFNPEHFDAAKILAEVRTKSFFTTLPEDVYWDLEEIKLKTALQTLMP
jgi:glycosyltransferase involved in cell wall biosynthesis